MLSLLLSAAFAQGIVIDVPGSADVPLAAPATQNPAGTGAADAVWAAMWKDFEMSGYFELQDPRGYLEKKGGITEGSFPMDQWTPLKTTVLVKTAVYPAGHASCGGKKACADAYVYHVPSGDTLMKRRYKVEAGQERALGHAIANEVLEATTGERGVFGARIAAVSSSGGNKEIVLLDLDGEGVSRVTHNGSINLSPALSPNGTTIAWTSYKKSNPDLYAKNLGSGRTRVLSNLVGVNTSPAFSPDGSTIAMVRSTDGDADIFLIDANSGKVRKQITKGGGIDVSPTYSPDGAWIFFASERSGGSQIYKVPAGGGEAERLSFVGDFNVDPAVSPKGDQVAWVSRSGGGFDIYVATLGGREAVRITQDMGDNEDPIWTSDGKYLVFSSTRSGSSELWLSSSDGRVQTQITKGGGYSQPAWGPR